MRNTKESGITLIALIITIIVMLILVGVTVTVALNGGLFSTSKTAAKDTQIEVDRETLQLAVWETIGKDGKMHLENLKLPNGFTENNRIYESEKGNKFIITEDGVVKPVIARNSTELERYIFGEEGLGRDLVADNIFDEENFAFIDNSLTVRFLTVSGLDIMNNDEYLYEFYVEYQDKVYKFQTIVGNDEERNKPTITTDPTEEIKLVYEAEEGTKVGKYVEYDGKNWIVLYDDTTNGLQMISENVLEIDNVYLGYRDETAQTPGDIDKDGTENTDKDKAIYSYNNAIERLNKKCESLVTAKEGVITGVRSVGSNPVSLNSENLELYESENLKNWNALYNKLGKSTDQNFVTDFDRMAALGINIGTNESGEAKDYWVASRLVGPYSGSVNFGVRNVGTDGFCDGGSVLWYVSSGGSAYGNYGCDGVRPVVSLKSGVLDGLTGEGTAENPLKLQ